MSEKIIETIQKRLEFLNIKTQKDVKRVIKEDVSRGYKKLRTSLLREGQIIWYDGEVLFLKEHIDSETYINEEEEGHKFKRPEQRNPKVFERVKFRVYVLDITFSVPYYYEAIRSICVYKGKYKKVRRGPFNLIDRDLGSRMFNHVDIKYNNPKDEALQDDFLPKTYARELLSPEDLLKRIIMKLLKTESETDL